MFASLNPFVLRYVEELDKAVILSCPDARHLEKKSANEANFDLNRIYVILEEWIPYPSR